MYNEQVKDLYRKIEWYRSQIETLCQETSVYEKALTDIVSCNVPNIPIGVTVSMEQFGPFARLRAEKALKDTEYYTRIERGT